MPDVDTALPAQAAVSAVMGATDPGRALVPSSREDEPAPVVDSPGPRRRALIALALVAAGAAAAGGLYRWRFADPEMPAGIAFGNGRLEADEIDIATKFSGRIATVLADEGDFVRAGQVLARMDTSALEMSLRKAQAQVIGANRMLDEAQASIDQQKAQATFAAREYDRALLLADKGHVSAEILDQRHQQLDIANAGLAAAKAKAGEAEQTLAAANHDVGLYQIDIADNALLAPRDGQIQYRLANAGEVLGVGGKVLTMLDTNYVYMDVFLPTQEAGRVAVGSEARILLDAFPAAPVAAKAVFVSPQAQFTPKAVETKTEREKLVFRVRVRADQGDPRLKEGRLSAGSPGLAYVRHDDTVAWPNFLALQPTNDAGR